MTPILWCIIVGLLAYSYGWFTGRDYLRRQVHADPDFDLSDGD